MDSPWIGIMGVEFTATLAMVPLGVTPPFRVDRMAEKAALPNLGEGGLVARGGRVGKERCLRRAMQVDRRH